jgi:tRNA-Thr(GGU) m(6)t(6)A37 methyltransferase TsaA
MTYTIEPIGKIITPFKTKAGMPIQSNGAKGIKGQIVLKEAFVEGLTDLDGFSHIIVIYRFHRSEGFEMLTTPFLDTKKRGLFATRAPNRPNSIGLSVVRLISIEGNILNIENVDMLDGTPLLDIKPYIPAFDVHEADRVGWTEERTNELPEVKSDNRFE